MNNVEYSALSLIIIAYGAHRRHQAALSDVDAAIQEAMFELGDDQIEKAEAEAKELNHFEGQTIAVGSVVEGFDGAKVAYLHGNSLVKVSFDLHEVLETVYGNIGW